MVEVPRPDGYSVAPTSAPVYQQANPPGLAFGEGFAEELFKISDTVTKHAVYMQQMDNKAATDEATTVYMKKAGEQKADYGNLYGKDAYEGYQSAVDTLSQTRDEVRATLQNSQQRMLFDQETRRLQDYTIMDMAGHARDERKKYLVDTSKGKIAGYKDAMNPYDDNSFAASKEGIDAEVAHQGAMMGDPPEFVKAAQFEQTSDLWKNRIQIIGNDDPAKATQMLREHHAELTPDDFSALSTQLHSYSEAENLEQNSNSIMNGFSGPADVKTTFDRMIKVESGGQAGIGGPITSHGQAFGLTQVMDGTGQDMAKKLGIAWRADLMRGKTEEAKQYQYKIGYAYFNDLYQHYGNIAVAAAAYNAGPGNAKDPRVDAWLARFGDPSKGEISTAEWIEKIPFKETQNYVKNTIGAIEPAVVATSDNPEDHLVGWLKTAEGYGDPLYADKLQKLIAAKTNRMLSAYNKARQGAQDLLVTALDGGEQGQGPKPTTIGELFATKGAKEAYSQLRPKEQSAVLGQLNQNAIGETRDTIATLANSNKLFGLATNNPIAFGKVNLLTEPDLTRSERKTLLALQRRPMALQAHLLHALDIASMTPGAPAKLDPENKAAGPTDNYNRFTGRLLDELKVFISTHNRQPSDEDVRKISAKMLATPDPASWWKFWGEDQREYQLHPHIGGGPSQIEVPDSEALDITNQVYARYKRLPSPDEIRMIFAAHRKALAGSGGARK